MRDDAISIYTSESDVQRRVRLVLGSESVMLEDNSREQAMTEAEWLVCDDPHSMLHFMYQRFWSGMHSLGQKMYRTRCALCRRNWAHLTEPARALLLLYEQYVEKWESRTLEDYERLEEEIRRAEKVAFSAEDAAVILTANDELGKHEESIIDMTAGYGGYEEEWQGRNQHEDARENLIRELAAEAELMRDIFGNPFHPISFLPEWRTDTAFALARQMYDSHEFSAMPILADALQDAGCDNEDILNHCRDTSHPHVRGCWVVDLILSKDR